MDFLLLCFFSWMISSPVVLSLLQVPRLVGPYYISIELSSEVTNSGQFLPLKIYYTNTHLRLIKLFPAFAQHHELARWPCEIQFAGFLRSRKSRFDLQADVKACLIYRLIRGFSVRFVAILDVVLRNV